MSPWKCIFGHMSPVCVAVNHKTSQWVPYGGSPRDNGWVSDTVATMRCETCGDIWTNDLEGAGSLTVPQINGG